MSEAALSRFRKLARWLAAGALTLGFLALAAATLDLGAVAHALAQTNPAAWAGVIALSAAMTGLRFLRIAEALNARPSFPLFRVAAAHGAALAVLPARTGEAAFPIALRAICKRSMAGAVGALLLIRLGDLAVLTAMAGGLAFLLRDELGMGPWAFPALLALAAPLLWALIPYAAGALAKRTRIAALRKVSAGAADIDRFGPARLFAHTAALWLILALAAQVAARGAGLELPFAHAALAGVAASFAFALPVNGLASAGPFEAAFAGALALLGHAPEQALAAAILLHVAAIFVALASAAGAEGVVALRLRARST
ncbi:MAG: lysylphosphatidylglycerol synthase domain-containing protein [Pseudomonadota bacterium]